MDVSNMTLEGFFLADYQRLREENEELKSIVTTLSNDTISRLADFGVHDCKQTCEAVKVETCSSYNFYTSQYGFKLEDLRKAYGLDNEGLLEWATKTYKGSSYYSTTPISVTRRKFQYTLRFVETRSDETFVTDGKSGSTLVAIDNMEENMVDNLGEWCRERYLGELEAAALVEVRRALKRAIETIEEREGEKDAD